MNNTTDRKEWFHYIQQMKTIKKIVIIRGLRRIGKTVILKNIKSITNKDVEVIEHKFNTFGIDDGVKTLEIFNKIKENNTQQFLLLLDEFQDFDDWNKFFSSCYDLDNVKIVATGSASHNISSTDKTEGGRYFLINLPTLSFDEYISIHQKRKRDLKSFYDYATFGSYPIQDWTTGIVDYKNQVSENIIEKIKDSNSLNKYGIKNCKHVEIVLLDLVSNIGAVANLNRMSKRLGIDKRTISKIIEYLKNVFLIYQVNNSKIKAGAAAADNQKYYFTDHTFYLFFYQNHFKDLEIKIKSAVFENIIFNSLKSLQYQEDIKIHFEIDRKSKIDWDLIVIKEDKKKYFEIKLSESENSLSKEQKAFASENEVSIIYLGGTKTINNKQYINILEFLKEKQKWI